MKESIKKSLVSNRIGWILFWPQCMCFLTIIHFKGLFLHVNLKTRCFEGQNAKVHKSKKTSSNTKILSDLVSKLLILFVKKKRFCDEWAQTDVLKNILPPNSILSKFSELHLNISHFNMSAWILESAGRWPAWSQSPTYKCVHYMVLDPLEVGVAPAICPCIFGTGEYFISAGAPPPEIYLLMCFSL